MIRALGVGLERHGRPVLDGIDLHVGAGEAVALAGKSAAGRTTLLRVLATLMRPSAGTVEIDGVDAVRRPLRARRHLAFAPDVAPFCEKLSIREYLDFLGAARVADGDRRRAAVAGAIELAGVDPEWSLHRLSQGQAQRLAVAAALLPDAAVRLLDEPFSAQDTPTRALLVDALQSRRRAGEALLIACKRPGEAAELFDRVVLMHAGRIIGVRPPDESGATPPQSSGAHRAGA